MRGTRRERMAELMAGRPMWTPQTIWGLFSATAQRVPDRDFLVYEDGRRYTYGQAFQESLAMQHALRELGVRAGDVVALKSANRPESVVLSLALSGMRVVKASLNPGLGPYELAFALRQSGARFLFTDHVVDFSGQESIDFLECVVTAANQPAFLEEWAQHMTIVGWENLLAGNSCCLQKPEQEGASRGPHYLRDEPPEAKMPFEVSDIMFTSGSTGHPKGAQLSHDMLLRSAWANCLNRGFEEGRRIFVPLPLFHVYGYVEGLLAALFVGGTLLMLAQKAQPAQALSFMKRDRANDILSVPSLMLKYLEELEQNPLEFPDLHAVYCSASACPDTIWPDIRTHFGVDDVITGYGMTEVSGASLQTRPGDGDDILSSRVGVQMPCGGAGMARYGGAQMEYRVVNPQDGRLCKPGEIGELQCRGAVVCYGYCNDEEASARSFADDGWFRTGDTGRFDAYGYLELSGRIKDSYKINGENVSTLFVEQIMRNHPEVEEVCVVGIPDARLGAVGAVFVELKTDTEEHREAFERYCRDNLARFQVPKYYRFLTADEWPRTPVGKVKKEDLRVLIGTTA